jgi:hypothetical protein
MSSQWNQFRSKMKGKGYTVQQLSEMYKKKGGSKNTPKKGGKKKTASPKTSAKGATQACASVKGVFLLVEYDEGSREEITVLGSYCTRDQAIAAGKKMKKKNDDLGYYISTCPVGSAKSQGINYFQYEIK